MSEVKQRLMQHGKCELGADRRPVRHQSFLLLCTMENGPQIRTQLAEKRLKLDSSTLYYEVAPTRPAPAPAVRISSHTLTCVPQTITLALNLRRCRNSSRQT